MKKDLCEIIVIIDESGSMEPVTNDTIGGFNTFLKMHQELPGEALLTLVKFNTEYIIVHNGVKVQDVPKLDDKTYKTGGCTALLDAVGKTIDEVGKRLANTPEEERPESVILMIITDGEENSSKEYNLQQVKDKIKHQQEVYSWDISFLGANQDAWANAGGMGISNAINYKNTGKTWMGMSSYSGLFRMSRAANELWEPVVEANKIYNKSEEELDKDLKDLKNKNNKT